jgi:hypothetical protein
MPSLKPSLHFLAGLVVMALHATAIPLAFGQSPTVLMSSNDDQPQYRQLQLEQWPIDGQVKLKGPLPSIIKVWLKTDSQPTLLEFGFNVDASEVTVFLPERKAVAESVDESKITLEFLITENTTTHADGVVVLSALDSKVIGTQAKLETHPGSHRIGYWVRKEDYVQWTAAIPQGTFDVELVYSRANETGTEVKFQFDDESLGTTLAKTGSWYRYRTMPLGQVTIHDHPEHQVEAHVTKIVNGGVMNLKAIVLTPAK